MREILTDHEATSKQIKQRINLYKQRLKKRLEQHPEYQEILDRLEKYSSGLYHGYDDPRIPLDNLALERLFNVSKRHFRKRTGLKERTNFVALEGELFFIASSYVAQLPFQSEQEFIQFLQSQRSVFTTAELSQLITQEQRQIRQKHTFMKKKCTLVKALGLFGQLKKKMSKISSTAY